MAFYIRLKKFFEKHDPDRLYMIKKIVQNFRNDEDAVMERLEEIYRTGGPSKLISTNPAKSSFSHNISDSSSHQYSSSDDDSHVDNSNDSIDTDGPSSFLKSKKKLIISIAIIIIGIIVGYFGVGMFLSGDENHTDDAHSEEVHATDDHSEAENSSNDKHEEEVPAVIEEKENDVVEDTTATNTDTSLVDQNADSLSVEQDEEMDSNNEEDSNEH